MKLAERMLLYAPIEWKFWAKVRIQPGCWKWSGSLAGGGYGRIAVNGKMCWAHRISYEWMVGKIPEGMEVDHKCGNRWCVNPEHLRPCTLAQNQRNRGLQRNNRSGFKGVSRNGSGGWAAQISGKWLGKFDTKEAAFAEYCRVGRELHGEFFNSGASK